MHKKLNIIIIIILPEPEKGDYGYDQANNGQYSSNVCDNFQSYFLGSI